VPARKSPPHRARLPARVLRRATQGDRPFQIGILVLVAVLGTMAWAPVNSLGAGAARVEQLTASRDKLAEEVERLEERKEQLMDPQELELMAREDLGLVKPGEIPYVVVTPEADPQLRAEGEEPPADERAWYQRLWDAVTGLVE
jgi:cell division protein FtsB